MDIENLTDDQLDDLASKLAGRLPTGRHGDKIVTTRRQLLAATLGGSAGVAALVKLGIDPATAQSAAGQVGTQSSPEDVFAYDLDVQGALQRDLDAGGQAIKNAGSVSTAELDTGRTWVEVSGNRSLDTEYTNNSDSEILVNVTVVSEADATAVGLNWTGGVGQTDETRLTVDLNDTVSIRTTVPVGQTYTANAFGDTGGFSIKHWHEFRR